METSNRSHELHFYSIDEFLSHAKRLYHINPGQVAGFRITMIRKGMKYVTDPRRYIKPLRQYLNN